MKRFLAIFGLSAIAIAADLPPLPVVINPTPRTIPIAWCAPADTNGLAGFGVYWFDAQSFHYQDAAFDASSTNQNAWLSNAVPPIRVSVATADTNGWLGDRTPWVIWPVTPPRTNGTQTFIIQSSPDLMGWTTIQSVVIQFNPTTNAATFWRVLSATSLQ